MTARLRSALLLLVAVSACGRTPASPPGLRNFHQVNEHLYRGAQPAVWGYQSLASMGIKTIVDLRGEGLAEAVERKLAREHGLNFISMPLDGHRAPSNDEITRLLKLLDDDAKWPIFVHCRRGADRTGTVIACYRIAHDKWDNQKALEEAMSYTMDPGQKLMRRFILQFQVSIPTLSAPTGTTAAAK